MNNLFQKFFGYIYKDSLHFVQMPNCYIHLLVIMEENGVIFGKPERDFRQSPA